jgi:hypothetical protein
MPAGGGRSGKAVGPSFAWVEPSFMVGRSGPRAILATRSPTYSKTAGARRCQNRDWLRSVDRIGFVPSTGLASFRRPDWLRSVDRDWLRSVDGGRVGPSRPRDDLRVTCDVTNSYGDTIRRTLPARPSARAGPSRFWLRSVVELGFEPIRPIGFVPRQADFRDRPASSPAMNRSACRVAIEHRPHLRIMRGPLDRARTSPGAISPPNMFAKRKDRQSQKLTQSVNPRWVARPSRIGHPGSNIWPRPANGRAMGRLRRA